VASAVVQLVDASGSLPHAIEGRCRLCGEAHEHGARVVEGLDPRDAAAVRAGLARWAAAEGEPDADAFTRANFGGRSADDVVAAVVAGDPVDTGFDVVAWLFGGAAGAGTGTAVAAHSAGMRAARTAAASRSADALAERGALPVAAAGEASPFDPTDVTRALVSALIADGRDTPERRAALERHAARLGAGPVGADALHVWRPHELGPVADPAAVLDAMRRIATAHGHLDVSALRVLREYARHWGLTLDETALPASDAVAQGLRSLRGLFAR
jgi:hypothetical protein